MELTESGQEGRRERKRRETHRRVTEAALGLFASQGYEATTLDAIAEAAGIARRTFFHYFASKEAILAAWQSDLPEVFRDALLNEPIDQSPLDAVLRVHLKLAAHYDDGQAIVIDRIIRSNAQLRAGNQAKYLHLEQVTAEALHRLWPEPERRNALRMVAMVSVGALRLAIERWSEGEGRPPLTAHLRDAFADLRTALSGV
ncbi:transcriptional regulator [Methylobacterium sp. Leaf123]|uniref:TetR/AcrR family transcriptional regulator n=1 Tax=Methylobacterium sp. Leaf123 TaxID=1736264 RepID=UPI0006F5D4A2|nr:TetR/AcrR family transcriptional regulator [Methylobacterium sp. Leaf123]KQQ27094.1 transcriptional regulator [Methylobacterium sp. Leaf123]